MRPKSYSFSLVILLFLVMFIGGCISLPQNQQYSDLEERVTKIEERIDKIEEQSVVLDEKTVAKESKVSLGKKIEKSEAPKQFIRFPSNEDIQTALKNAGLYDGEVDGQIGTKTRNAIKEFQKQNDLEIDGVVGRNTWDILGKYYYISNENTAEPKDTVESKVEEVKDTQIEVKEAQEKAVAPEELND